MPLTTRRLGPNDPAQVHTASRALGVEAFGPYPPHLPPPALPEPGHWPDGVGVWATFDDTDIDDAGAPRMAGRIRTHAYRSFWGGADLATCGLAGVAVATEYRGRGLLHDLMGATLRAHAAAGDAVAALYPTAPGIYRGFGFEVVTSYDQIELPTAALSGVRTPDPHVRLRRARDEDASAVASLYTAWARDQNGPLTRTGPLFEAARTTEHHRGITLAEVDAEPVGFVSWERSSGYGADKVLEVDDLIASDAESARALWRAIGTFSPVTGLVRVWTSAPDTTRLVLPQLAWTQTQQRPYMTRVLDLPAALAARAPVVLDGRVVLRVEGDPFDLVDGTWELEAHEGRLSARRISQAPALALSVQGLSLLHAGTLSAANLRHSGHLSGPEDHDAVLDAWFGGRQAHVRDYF